MRTYSASPQRVGILSLPVVEPTTIEEGARNTPPIADKPKKQPTQKPKTQKRTRRK